MHIPPCRIHQYLSDDCRVTAYGWDTGEDRVVTRSLNFPEVKSLAEREKIDGTGTPARLKHVTLRCTWDEAEQAIRLDKPAQAGRGSITTQASRTVEHETINGTKRTFHEYRHTGGRRFAPNLRREWV